MKLREAVLVVLVFICIVVLKFDDKHNIEGILGEHNMLKQEEPTDSDIVKDGNTVNVVITACERPGDNNLTDHMVQLNTLLKTIYLLSTTPVTVYFLHNQENIFKRAVLDVKEWGLETQHKIRLKSVPISYPQRLDSMIKEFKTCSPARLFIHEMLPDVDAAIFLDSDVILMDNIQNLWNYFRHFSSAQLVGMAATENIYNEVKNLPYYGPPGVGLNGGVMLLNLTRMRAMSGAGFTGSVRWVYSKYQSLLWRADQDILNIIFGTSPWYMYELPCTWNYVMWQCRVDAWAKENNPRTWDGKNQCKGAEKRGVSIMHGDPAKFGNNFEPLFEAVHKFWLNYNVAERLVDSLPNLRDSIKQVVERKEGASPCSKVEGIEHILLYRLETLAQSL